MYRRVSEGINDVRVTHGPFLYGIQLNKPSLVNFVTYLACFADSLPPTQRWTVDGEKGYFGVTVSWLGLDS